MDPYPFPFHHYDLIYFALYVNGKQIPSGALYLDMGHEKTVVGYRSIFEASGIHHSNTGSQITHDMCVGGYFMLLFDVTPDRGASEGHTSYPDNGSIRLELNSRRHYLMQ